MPAMKKVQRYLSSFRMQDRKEMQKNAGARSRLLQQLHQQMEETFLKKVSTEKSVELVKGYGEAAERAMKGGADAVEIHMAHGYLVNSFMSPRTNKRVDEFGGNLRTE